VIASDAGAGVLLVCADAQAARPNATRTIVFKVFPLCFG